MAKTFKQQVEEILCETFCPDVEDCKFNGTCSIKKNTTARILAAHNAELDSREKHCTAPEPFHPCCIKIPNQEGCDGCPYWQPTPTEQMPLREQFQHIVLKGIWESHKWLNLSKTLDALMKAIEAHDQQVRQEFAEKVINELPVWRLRLPLSEDISKIIEAHIRAMAGGR